MKLIVLWTIFISLLTFTCWASENEEPQEQFLRKLKDRDEKELRHLLLRLGDQIDPSVKTGKALTFAAKKGHLELLQLLMAHPKMTSTDIFESALEMAYRKGRVRCLIELLGDPQVPVQKAFPKRRFVVLIKIDYLLWSLSAELLDACANGDSLYITNACGLSRLWFWQYDLLIRRARHHKDVIDRLRLWQLRAYGVPSDPARDRKLVTLMTRLNQHRTSDLRYYVIARIKFSSVRKSQVESIIMDYNIADTIVSHMKLKKIKPKRRACSNQAIYFIRLLITAFMSYKLDGVGLPRIVSDFLFRGIQVWLIFYTLHYYLPKQLYRTNVRCDLHIYAIFAYTLFISILTLLSSQRHYLQNVDYHFIL